MVLKPCPECKAQISATADTCPRCGYSFKKRNRDRAQVGCLFVLGFIALLGAMSIGSKDTEPNEENSQPPQGATASPSHAENQSHVGPQAHCQTRVQKYPRYTRHREGVYR